jgi:hypothetical protein
MMPTLSLTAREFNSLYLQDDIDDLNSGVRREEDETTPNAENYGDMNTDKRLEDTTTKRLWISISMLNLLWVLTMNDADACLNIHGDWRQRTF